MMASSRRFLAAAQRVQVAAPAYHRAVRVAGGALLAGGATALACSPQPASECKASFFGAREEQSVLVLSGDCGGTNTRLMLFRVPAGTKAEKGKVPQGEVVLQKHYRNAESGSFTACCEQFLAESDQLTRGERPKACCLACAGGIKDNCVSFTNVKDGWTIDGTALQSVLRIPKITLINDFEAQGYGLLTLRPEDVVQLNEAKPIPGRPIACVGAGTGLGECFLTAGSDGVYTCFPSEGGHAEYSPRTALQMELLEWLREQLAFDSQGSPEKIDKYFKQWDTDGNGSINKEEFTEALRSFDLKGLKPRRVSVERVISGPGLANIYGFLRRHWAFEQHVDAALDAEWMSAPKDKRGAIVAKCSAAGNHVCQKAVDVFAEAYGAECGVAALKWLPYGGLYVSGGIGAKNPHWIQHPSFLNAYKDKGRLSELVMSVPLYLVLAEDTGERGALFYAVQMLSQQ
eukprot:jgi/Chrpa1/18558/Chrysochromulina_OHIO_Genome00024720-RA